ncbi:uncharacterized protein DUF3515 [Sanguibacter antarcticus]|uniref:Uncharacterized protein DUF3515 n=1 Tax=Sanguibacter antarcticus TaxID=372484 RepID=A0A2A9E2A4_9MICO|nr:uncharacterized protein DUF3515 [Sanguibacter antarcticus]
MLAATTALVVSGCVPTINVTAADAAGDPLCARVVLAVPETVLGQPKVRATGQATAAWGEAGAAITLTCGVEVPPPTTEECESIQVVSGGVEQTFDWITTKDDNGWTYVSFGRDPAVAVQVPTALGLGQPTAALIDLAGAISQVETTRTCL